MTLGYPTSVKVLGLKGQGLRVNECIFHTIASSITQKRDPKMFKLGVGNDLGISYKWYGFGVERSVSGLGLAAIWRGFDLCECLVIALTVI